MENEGMRVIVNDAASCIDALKDVAIRGIQEDYAAK
jgi:hypothetical protein